MRNFRTLVELFNISSESLSDCHLGLLNGFTSAIEEMDAGAAIQNRSSSFKELMEKSTSSLNMRWEKTSIFKDRALSEVNAIYRLDAVSKCDGTCGDKHYTNFVYCLNNRESIGTNILKLETAAAQEIRHHQQTSIYDRNILGILITLSESTLRTGEWDNSYGYSSEYVWALNNAYSDSLKSQFAVININLA